MKAGLSYAKRLGWRVLPVEPGGKKPILPDWANRASNDPAVIAGWIAAHPDANVGVAPDGEIFVLDVDPKNGGDEELAKLEAEFGELPDTPQQATPSGGKHFVFKAPAGGVSNSASKIAPGIDIRGKGGQFVVAPSKTEKGSYRWVRSPLEIEPAEAPAWLLERLSKPVERKAGPTGDRGWFPAASPEIIAEARNALDAHGPAIEGKGGDAHTMAAAALLTHDFALTPDEAWPLLLEWNESCRPAWDEPELRTKLHNGSRYGKRPYGCKRKLDALAACRRGLELWDGTLEDQARIIERLRNIEFPDKATRAIILKETRARFGMTERDLDFPRFHAPVPELKQGEIRMSTDLHRVADESLRAIAPAVFARNGVLCEVVSPGRTFIHDLEPARIQDLMSRAARFLREDEKAGVVYVAAPERVATILSARRDQPGVRVLDAVTTAPIFLPNGEILQERGYNREARVFLEPSVTVSVPDAPTRDDARASIRALAELLSNFEFAAPADFSAWVAALLSPLVKAATENAPAPLFCISASSPGAGKSLLADVLARIVMGTSAEIRPYNPKDPSEWGKRLTAFVKMASPVNVFDNVNGAFGDEGLDRLITSSTWSDRQLGASEAPPLPNVGTWIATGNNIEPQGDTVRRVLMIRLKVKVERPQERTGFAIPQLAEHAQEHRGELLAHALTILRAFHVAGRPESSTRPLAEWGSFTTWSRLVRGALVWTGCADPYLTQKRASDEFLESDNEAHDFWIDVISGCDGTTAAVAASAEQKDGRSILGLRTEITAHHVKKLIARFVDKPRRGAWIQRTGGRYVVLPVA